MKKTPFILSILLLPTLIQSCGKVSPAGLKPLAFDKLETKAGLSSIYSDFKVWTSFQNSESSSDIMSGYRVNYTAEGWSYTSGEGTDGQELQFWSESQGSYRFHAGAPYERVNSIDASSLTLKLKASTNINETALFSTPYYVRRTDPAYGNIVSLSFRYANARVNVAFRCTSSSEVNITGITLTPPAGAEYVTAGSLQVSYDWKLVQAVPGSTSIESTSIEPLSFSDISVPAGEKTSQESASPHYMVPCSGIKGQWTATMTVDGLQKSVQFTIDKPWEAGRSYLYRFEYTDEANLVFIGTDDVLFIGEDLADGGNHNFN